MVRNELSKNSDTRNSTTKSTGEGSHDRISARAYEFYEQRSIKGVDGNALSDWIAAECDLEARESRSLNGAETDGSGI